MTYFSLIAEVSCGAHPHPKQSFIGRDPSTWVPALCPALPTPESHSPLSTSSLLCPLTDHQLCEADVELLWVRDRTWKLHILQRVVVPEVDLREAAAPKAAQEAQAMAAPLAGGHGHSRPGGIVKVDVLGPHCDLDRKTDSIEGSGNGSQVGRDSGHWATIISLPNC